MNRRVTTLVKVWRNVQGNPFLLFAGAVGCTMGGMLFYKAVLQPRLRKSSRAESEAFAEYLYQEELKRTSEVHK